MPPLLTRIPYVRWRTAIFAIFLTSGLSVATWASRVPALKADLGVTNAQIGLLLLGMGIASILGIAASPLLLSRLGARQGMFAMMLLFATGLGLVGAGASALGSFPVVIAGLILFGFGNGGVDVMMNVEAAEIEQRGGRTIMPLFHAFFSFGTVIGAGLGWVAAASDVSVGIHAGVVSALIAVIAVLSAAHVPKRAGSDAAEPRPRASRLADALSAWREPRTYSLGVILLGMAFAEGGANDWIALGVSEEHGGGPDLGAAALTVFAVSMTTVRVFGGGLVDRFGRVVVLRVLAVLAVAGLLLFIFAPTLPAVFFGAALWGVGTSLGFPLGMSAAADDPMRAAARVSAASAIGYVALLAGPPLLGMISERIGLLNALLLLVVLVAASGLASGAARPLPGTPRAAASD